MTGRIRRARRRGRVGRGRVVYAAPSAPVWVPEPGDRDASLLVRIVRRGRGPDRFQPVEEAALRTVSDASAVLSVMRR